MKITQELPQKDELVTLIQRTKTDLNLLVKKIIRWFLAWEPDTKKIHEVFSYVYEKLYHDIIFERIPLDQKTARLIELLATPMSNISAEEQKEVLRHIFRRSQFVRTRFGG
jgi:hypothetical protein